MITPKPSSIEFGQIKSLLACRGDRVTADTIQWVQNWQDDRAVEDGCWFDAAAGKHVCDFFETMLCHSTGEWAGQPFLLMPVQRDILMRLFGWRRKDGKRRFRRAGIWVAKKNFKTTMAAGLIIYMMLFDGEASAEVYSAAKDKNQAAIMFREASKMVRASPSLRKHVQIIPSTKTLLKRADPGCFYRALSKDYKGQEGLNAHCVLPDELHVVDRELFETLRFASAARSQPMLITISTAGFDKESLGHEEYTYAKDVMLGTFYDPEFFPYIAEADPSLPIDSEEAIRQANPGLGVTIKLEEVLAAAREAKNSPRKENAYRRYRLNQWTDSESRWITSQAWDQCGGVVNDADLEGASCGAGLDLSSNIDMTAYVLAFLDDDGVFTLKSWFFLPEENLDENEKRSGLPRGTYQTWVNHGFLTLTPGNVVDYDFVLEAVRESKNNYDLLAVGYDRWGSEQVTKSLDEAGIEVVEFGQGYASMSGPAKDFEASVLGKCIRHGNNPILQWQMANCVVESDAAGNIKPSKAKSGRKIDGIVAAIMACQMARSKQGQGGFFVSVID